MSNYRETMTQTLEFMRIMHEYKILERTLTDTEQKRREEIAQDMNDSDFKSRYGDRWKEVKMAVATKQAKKEAYEDDEAGDPDDEYDDEEERQQTEKAKQLKDPKKEMMVSKGGKVEVIDKKDWDKFKKKGYIQAEEVELDEGIIDKVKDIASKKQAAKIDGVLVDMFTASAISQIYDKVNDANKKKMENLPIVKLAKLAMKMMQKNEYIPEEVDLDEAKIVFKTKAKDGGHFVVLDRDTSGMRGKQDKFLMRHMKGGKVKDWGSHVSVDGAKKFAINRGIIDEETILERIDRKLKERKNG